jgi:hypothetical protein
MGLRIESSSSSKGLMRCGLSMRIYATASTPHVCHPDLPDVHPSGDSLEPGPDRSEFAKSVSLRVQPPTSSSSQT